MMNWLGLDIGGANIKIGHGVDYSRNEPFALWREPENLAARLKQLMESAPPSDAIAATMTGELADCFRTKAAGVRAIIDGLVEAAGSRRLRIYLTSGEFVPPGEAVARAHEAAASNWHALACYATRFIESEMSGGSYLLIDIGSTTTDVIPVCDGQVVARGKEDTTRLIHSELVYTGVGRTPVAMVTDVLPWREQRVPVAREVFATALDAYLILGEIPEDETSTDTADRRSASRDAARDRLARMICADREMFEEKDALAASEYIQQCQVATIGVAVRNVIAAQPQPPGHIVLSGSGEFLGWHVARLLGSDFHVKSISSCHGPVYASCAAAHAVAALAEAGACN